MSASQSLYRKYRSQTFDELVGQEPVVRTLKNAIANDRIGHAYLFTGPRGVGKTSAARLLARAANCTAAPEKRPCNECPNCLAATRDIATDLIEIDAASNTGVDNIRELIERANFAPSIWHTKFYIIDEVHMLSISAFNALLKTLEEPPAHTSFVLATTEVHKVPATVASRCQRFDFRRIPLKAMLGRLQFICEQEGIEAETAALELVARQATGSLRDAESLLDQLRVFAEGGITLEAVQDMLGAGGSEEVAAFVDTLVARDMAEGLRRINGALEEGLDLRQYNRQVVEHLRGLMLIKTGAAQASAGLLDVTDEMRSRLQKQAESVSIPDLLKWMKHFSEADNALRSTVYGQLPLEMAFVAAIVPARETSEARDHRPELTAAAEVIGAAPAQRPAPTPATRQAATPPPASRLTAPPPPIHADLESMGYAGAALNGSGRKPSPTEEPLPEPPPEYAAAPEAVQNATPTSEPGTDSEAELQRLIELWPDLVSQIKARSRAIAAVFGDPNQTRPVSVIGPKCTVAFRDAYYVTRSQQEQQRAVIEMALSRVLGYKCILESITYAESEGGEASPTPKRAARRDKQSPYDDSRVKAATNIFGVTFEES